MTTHNSIAISSTRYEASLAGQLRAGVDDVLALIANEWCERGKGDPDYRLFESVLESLARIRESASEIALQEQSSDFSIIAEALHQSKEGAAILNEAGEIKYSNAALFSLSTVNTHSTLGHSLLYILNIDIADFPRLLKRVGSGIPWSGKVVSLQDSPREYWLSLSCSHALGSANSIVALVTDITEENTDTEQCLRQQAMHDKLTGLPNRRYFYEHLEKLLIELKQAGVGADICFIDLDDFKHVNDYTGHANGDLLLQAMGERIQSVFGHDAFVCRFGGDEFAAVLTDQNSMYGTEPYERLRQALREPFPLSEAEAQMSVSIGVTHFPEHGTEIDVLMSGADAAMYAAKSLGKNQVVLFSAELQADIAARHQVRTKLRRALDDGEIELWFQPKVDACTNALVGCEALARWRTQSGEYIPPSRFVPVAERTGLISPLGNKVFQLAAEQAVRWRSEGKHTNIAVNVSPQQLRHPRFVQQLQQILDQTQAEPAWFELEITENAVVEDVKQAVDIMRVLTQLGFRIAIDDFGTGYSSLSYLKNFNIHTLKIDLSFVRDLIRDHHSDAIVRSIISLGSGLGLTLVAEGVETEQQADFLRDAGCDVLQGYLIGKPVPAPQFEQWFQAR
ncbi:MAG: EAL domain-containing protein [Pirellulaceae bacterium]|nr:EAL domain-containing protein [Pirellulaceae bacterium]